MPPASNIPNIPPRIVFGFLCGLAAAVLYTAANICLRSVSHIDSVWVAAIRALPSILMMIPLLGIRLVRNQGILTTWANTRMLIITGIVAQFFGNVGFQWALGIVGIAISVPLVLGSMIVASATIGWLWLGEPVSRRTVFGIGLLIVAVVTLSIGAQKNRPAQTHVASQKTVTGLAASELPLVDSTNTTAVISSPESSKYHIGWVIAAVLSNLSAGVAYSVLGSVMRHSMKQGTPVETTLFVLSSVGFTFLTTLAIMRLGVSGLLATPKPEFGTMMLAGAFNAVAFFAIAKALQQVTVVVVHMLNATQAAMAALAGWWWFDEQLTIYVWTGVGLTALGLVIAGSRSKPKENLSQPELDSTLPVEIPAPVASDDDMDSSNLTKNSVTATPQVAQSNLL